MGGGAAWGRGAGGPAGGRPPGQGADLPGVLRSRVRGGHAYKQREGEAALSAVGQCGRCAGCEGRLAGPGGRPGGPRWALPPGPAAGEEGRKVVIGHGAWPSPYLAGSSALSAASSHAPRPVDSGGRRSWPLAGTSAGPLSPGQSWEGAGKGQALPSGQPPPVFPPGLSLPDLGLFLVPWGVLGRLAIEWVLRYCLRRWLHPRCPPRRAPVQEPLLGVPVV